MTDNKDRRFCVYSGCIIFLFIVILIFRWNWMPTFIDIYYHLLAMLNFEKLGGISLVSYWEYAPFGRAHLYPPFLHLLMLLIVKLKFSVLTIARLFEFLSFPVILLTIFLTIKRIYSSRLAFWSVLVAASMYSFFLSCVDFLAASLAFSLGMLTFYSLERKKIIAAIVFLALCLYSQVSISLFFLLALVIYGFFQREKLSFIIKISIIAFFFYLPFLIHQLRFISYIDLQPPVENFPLELNIIVYVLAIFGLFLAGKAKKEYSFFIAMLIAALPFLSLRYRFFSGQGMIGIIFLAALSLDFFYERLETSAFRKNSAGYALTYLLSVFLGLFLISPTISINKGEVKFNLIGSTYLNIFPSKELRLRTNEISIYLPKSFKPVFEVVLKETKPDDLIASNFEYLAGFISVFTNRPTTSGMLPEVKPFREINPFSYATLIIWLKDPDRITWQPEGLIRQFEWLKVAETDVFFIYKNPQARQMLNTALKKELNCTGNPEIFLPFWACAGILLILFSLAVLNLFSKI
ncbi:MAG: hypothetical protein AB1629_06600 [Candidatus Omnitrophota bacterium]